MPGIPPWPDDDWGRFVRGRDGFGRLVWVRPRHQAEHHDAIEHMEPPLALGVLEDWVRDDVWLIEALHDRAHGPPFELDPDRRRARLIRTLERDVGSGWLVFHRERLADGAQGTVPVHPAAPRDPRRPAQPQTTTWVEVALITAGGRRVAGEPIRVTTPSGAVVESHLDEVGVFRRDGLDPGICDVTFPRIDGREWGLGPPPWADDDLDAPYEADRTVFVDACDCVSSVAAGGGFRDFATVYRDHANEELRRRRPNPNLLGPRDAVVLPGRRGRIAEASTTMRTTFTVLERTTRLRVRFLGLRAQRYRLEVAGAVFAGTVEPSGLIDHLVPATASSGDLTLEAVDHPGTGQRFAIRIGDLDPMDLSRGERARLANLAFPPASVDHTDEHDTHRRAERAFASWAGNGYNPADLARRHDGEA